VLTCLHTTHGYSTDTTNLVHILERETEGLLGGALRGGNVVKGTEEGGASVPGHVGRGLNHVITIPSGNRHEWDLGGLVSDLMVTWI